MSREKQIEEMARDIFAPKVAIDGIDIAFAAVHGADKPDSHFMRIAEHLYNAGYRKQDEAFSRPHENGGEWISVEERLPEITETVLIAYKEKWEWETEWIFDVDVGSLDITGREWNTYHDLYEGQELHITHWMPLPEPPKMKGGGE